MKYSILTLSIACGLSFAQTPSTPRASVFAVEGTNLYSTSLNDFLAKVTESNAILSTKKLGVENALAMKDMMSIPNINPSITLSRGSYNKKFPTDSYTSSGVSYPWGGTMTSPQSNTFTLSGTIEGIGKRRSRINYAETEISKAQIDTSLTVKDVEGIATFAYVDALRLKLIWQAIQNSSNLLSAYKDSESDAALATHAAIQKSIVADFKYLALGLNSIIGVGNNDLPSPVGTLNVPTKNISPTDFTREDFEKRSDIISARAALKAAEASIDLTQKSRRIDVSASVWFNETPAYYSSSYGQLDTAQTAGLSLTFPIPLANLSNGALIQASNNKTQIEILIRDTLARASVEANQQLITYNASKDRLLDAQTLRDTTAKDTTRTTKNLVRQREVEVDLIDAQTFHLKSLIQLMRAIGDYSLPSLN
jgi:outer membrane protein TolC